MIILIIIFLRIEFLNQMPWNFINEDHLGTFGINDLENSETGNNAELEII